MDSENLLKNSIVIKLLRVIFSIYLCITLLMTLIQMFNEYWLEENDVKQTLEQSQLIFGESLVDSLWDFDTESLKATEKGIMQTHIIIGLQIFDDIEDKLLIQKGFVLTPQGKIIHAEKKETFNPYLTLLVHKFPLIKQGKKIGEATFYSSNEIIFDKVKYNYLIIIINSIIKTALLWILFIWAFNKYLSSQLNVFCYTMEKVNIDNHQENMPLHLKTFNTYELLRIEYLFNNMLKRILDSKSALDCLNKSLEEKIHLRTKELKISNQQLEKSHQNLEKYICLIEETAITDELTKLYNRRYFNQIFPKEIQRTIRDKQTISFLMMDVDNFKQYNDNYGHQKGDDVLSEIGKTLKLNCKRASDIALRLGGEEFGVIFSDINNNKQMVFAESIRQSIEMLQIKHEFNNASSYITASFGLVSITKPSKEINMDELYRLADEALYLAKENGRNQIKEIKI